MREKYFYIFGHLFFLKRNKSEINFAAIELFAGLDQQQGSACFAEISRVHRRP